MQRSKIYSAIDIGSTKISVAVAKTTDSDDIELIGLTSSPSTGLKKGQIVDITEAANSIISAVESAERMAGTDIKQSIVGFAPPHIESVNSKGLSIINSPNGEISQSDIEKAIESSKLITIPDNKEILHTITQKFSIDGQDNIIDPAGMSGVKLEVNSHLIFVSSPAVKNIFKCFHNIGIKINQLVYSGLVSPIVCLSDTEQELGVLTIDIGGYTTTITAIYDNYPVLSAVIPIGSVNITNDIAIGLGISLQDADLLKTNLISFTKKQDFIDDIELSSVINSQNNKKISLHQTISGIIEPRLNELFKLINDKIQDIRSQVPAGAVLIGGGSQVINIEKCASAQLNTTVRLGSVNLSTSLIDDQHDSSFASTIGLVKYQQKFKPQTKKHQINIPNFTNLFDKIKNFIEPLLP